MEEIDYTDPRYKDAAFALAEATPRHLDKPTTPPIHWRLEEGGILRVLLADGRTVRAPLPKGKVGAGRRPAQSLPAPIMVLPVHKTAAASKPPAKSSVPGSSRGKAGK